MFKRIKDKLVSIYLRRFKHMSSMDIQVAKLRKQGIKIGDQCRIFTNIASLEPSLICIGNRVTISSDVCFCTHDNAIIKAIPGKTDVVGPITIGDDCFIGMRSIIMYGVTLGDHCVVGAGAVVTHSFPSHSVVAGNPAKQVCTTEQYAEKYAPYAIDFRHIPLADRSSFFSEHPELMVRR